MRKACYLKMTSSFQFDPAPSHSPSQQCRVVIVYFLSRSLWVCASVYVQCVLQSWAVCWNDLRCKYNIGVQLKKNIISVLQCFSTFHIHLKLQCADFLPLWWCQRRGAIRWSSVYSVIFPRNTLSVRVALFQPEKQLYNVLLIKQLQSIKLFILFADSLDSALQNPKHIFFTLTVVLFIRVLEVFLK